MDDSLGVRPAFNLNLQSVIFKSAAVGGKPIAEGDQNFSAISTYSGNEWKLTLSDVGTAEAPGAHAGFALGKVSKSGGTFTISYSGAAVGENEYVSAVIVNASGEVTAYGRIAKATASGTVTINTSSFMSETDKLYIFNEQCNGDYKTDYASELIEAVPSSEFGVTVVGGTADVAVAAEGDTVSITAAAPEAGKAFVQWSSDDTDVSFANQGAAETTFTMPGHAVTIKAVYAPIIIGGLDEAGYTYTGSAIEPAVTVSLEGVDIKLTSEDYTISYDNNVDACDDATVSVALVSPRAGSASTTFTIKPRLVTITVAGASKLAGTDDPAFTGTVSGLVAEDNLGTISFVRTNTGVEAVGSYSKVLDATYSPNPNYDVTVVKGDFTIEESVTVTFDANGGTGAPAAQIIAKGGYATEPVYADRPQREHYGFGHWYAGMDVTDRFDFYKPVQGDVVLHAAWSGIVYAEENVVNDSSASLDPGVITVGGTVKDPAVTLAYEGTDVVLKATANEGFAFVGWARETGNADAPYEIVSTEATYTVTLGDAVGAAFGWVDLGFPGMGDAMAVHALFERVATVTFANEDGTVLQSGKIAYGQTPAYMGETPSKAATVEFTFTFKGWDKEIAPVTGDVTYKATYSKTTNEYTVVFANSDGTVLQSGKIAYGQTPAYVGETPEKASTAQYTYTFAGWDKEIAPASGDVTYTATYSNAVNEYTVTWVNDDGSVIKKDSNVVYGTVPAYKGDEPTKAATAQYTYSFAGWMPALEAVTGDVTYTATYTATVNEYTVQFLNDDGTVLQSGKVAYGQTPAYTGETPSKAATAEFTYAFAGWSPELASVTGDATYTAVFSQTLNTYTVTFVDSDGTVLQTGVLAYGETPIYEGPMPTKVATDRFSYEFAGWDRSIDSVTGETTYVATFTETPIKDVEPAQPEPQKKDDETVQPEPQKKDEQADADNGSKKKDNESAQTDPTKKKEQANANNEPQNGNRGNQDSNNRGGTPKTGDATSFVGLAALAACGLATLLGGVALRRKER